MVTKVCNMGILGTGSRSCLENKCIKVGSRRNYTKSKKTFVWVNGIFIIGPLLASSRSMKVSQKHCPCDSLDSFNT